MLKGVFLQVRMCNCQIHGIKTYVNIYRIEKITKNTMLLRATRGVRKPNLKVVVTNACATVIWEALDSILSHSCGLPLRMNGMQRTKCDHALRETRPISSSVSTLKFVLKLRSFLFILDVISP